MYVCIYLLVSRGAKNVSWPWLYYQKYTCIIKKPGQKRWEEPLKQCPPLRMSHQVTTRNTDYYIQHKIRSQNFFFEKHFRSSVFQAVV